jgi:hypothetical protein
MSQWEEATPIRRAQLSQCYVTYILIPKYVPFLHFPSLRLSVGRGSPANGVRWPTTERNKIIRSWYGPRRPPVRIVSTSPNHQAGRPSLFGCLRLLIQHIRSYLPHLKAIAPCATWRRTMLWWQEPTYHWHRRNIKIIIFTVRQNVQFNHINCAIPLSYMFRTLKLRSSSGTHYTPFTSTGTIVYMNSLQLNCNCKL